MRLILKTEKSVLKLILKNMFILAVTLPAIRLAATILPASLKYT
jgi:hypothetical protein